MKNIIYKIVNKVNGKVYIGQTTQGLRKRKSEHIYRYNRSDRDHKLYLAFKKYGINNFEFVELCSALSKEFLNELETHFINEYNSFTNGYNMTIGGDAISTETREKLSAAFKGRKITWYDKILESRSTNLNDRTRKYHKLDKDGMVIVVHNLKQYCKDNSIDYSNLYNKSKVGKRTKGYLLLESSTTSSFERRD